MPLSVSQARARNEASFRVEDQGGWQPDHVPIDAQQPLNTYLCTDLAVSTIAGKVLSAPAPVAPISGEVIVAEIILQAARILLEVIKELGQLLVEIRRP